MYRGAQRYTSRLCNTISEDGIVDDDDDDEPCKQLPGPDKTDDIPIDPIIDDDGEPLCPPLAVNDSGDSNDNSSQFDNEPNSVPIILQQPTIIDNNSVEGVEGTFLLLFAFIRFEYLLTRVFFQ